MCGALRMCEECRAIYPYQGIVAKLGSYIMALSYSFGDLTDNACWMQTQLSDAEYKADIASPFGIIIGFHIAMLFWDWMHSYKLGFMRDLIASALWFGVLHGFFGTGFAIAMEFGACST
jgi:hypothetical protein